MAEWHTSIKLLFDYEFRFNKAINWNQRMLTRKNSRLNAIKMHLLHGVTHTHTHQPKLHMHQSLISREFFSPVYFSSASVPFEFTRAADDRLCFHLHSISKKNIIRCKYESCGNSNKRHYILLTPILTLREAYTQMQMPCLRHADDSIWPF